MPARARIRVNAFIGCSFRSALRCVGWFVRSFVRLVGGRRDRPKPTGDRLQPPIGPLPNRGKERSRRSLVPDGGRRVTCILRATLRPRSKPLPHRRSRSYCAANSNPRAAIAQGRCPPPVRTGRTSARGNPATTSPSRPVTPVRRADSYPRPPRRRRVRRMGDAPDRKARAISCGLRGRITHVRVVS